MESEAASDGNQEFSPRDYQVEIFEEACKKNVIACLGTGTGKTFISVMLIKELAHQIRGKLGAGGKRTFFLVTTVPLVHQQSKVIEDHAKLKVGKYTGEIGVDFWDKATWEKQFNDHDVLVMTHQIMLNNLLHGYIKPSDINLLVLDECHHTNKNHPYMKIMEEIEDIRDEKNRPRVLGLTASIINEKTKKRGVALRYHLEERMRLLEANLRAVCFTCADQSSTLPYATKPVESILQYEPLSYNDDQSIFRTRQQMSEILEKEPRRWKDKAEKQAYEKFMGILKDLRDILEYLGIWCTYKAAVAFKEKNGLSDNYYSKFTRQIVNKIISLFENYAREDFGSVGNVILMEPMIAPKINTLLDLLWEFKQGRDLCAIVFVKQRVTSKVLSDLINEMVQQYSRYSGIKCDFVHGHSLLEIMSGSDGGTMTSKKQENILQRFRTSKFNVLISTSVVEEGLDVRKCNLVVRFDGLNNYREYVQSKGRARAAKSRFVILAEKSNFDEVQNDWKNMKEVEKLLIEKSRGRELPTEEEIEELRSDDELIPPFRISDEEGAAKISQDNAIQILYMYCSKLPSDRFTQPMPIFLYKVSERGIVATVQLPLNSPVRGDIKGDPMPTERLARISAAQEACIRLYEMGELDDHFVPISHSDASDDEEDDEETSIEAGEKETRHVYKRKIPDCFAIESHFPSTGLHLYALEITLCKPKCTENATALWQFWFKEDRKIFGLLTARLLPKVPSFPLFTKAGEVNVQVKHLQSELKLSQKKLDVISNFHKKMLQESIGNIIPDIKFSWENATSKALLVAVNDGLNMESKRNKQECQIEFEFMQKLCKMTSKDSSSSFEDAVIKKTYADTKSLFYVSHVRYDMKITDQIANDGPTFKNYYKMKYNKDIDSHQPLLESVQASRRINLISPRSPNMPEKSRGKTAGSVSSVHGKIHLIPELCEKLDIPASFHCQFICIPSALFRLETMLAAEHIRLEMLNGINGENTYPVQRTFPDWTEGANDGDFSEIMRNKESLNLSILRNVLPGNHAVVYDDLERFLHGKRNSRNHMIKPQVILQSLTTSKADAGFDLERLETLGDSFLKMATSIFLYFNHPYKNEGRLTSKRKKLISNTKLMQEAKKKGIPEAMCNTAFGLKRSGNDEDDYSLWIPPMFVKTSNGNQRQCTVPSQIIRDKSIADCVEAFIGAFFEHGGVEEALQIMKWFGISCFFEDLDTFDENGTSMLTKYADFIPPATALITETGSDQGHLVYELYDKNRFNALEKAIKYSFKEKSFLVQAFTHMSCYNNKVTDCYQRLEFLGDAVLDFLVIAHSFACNNELDPGSLTLLKSALVNNNTFGLLAIKNNLHKHLLHFEPTLHSAVGQLSELEDEEIDEQLKNPFIIILDENGDEGFHAPKFLGDIFESLAGAIFLDSGLDLVEVWKVFYPIMQPLIDQYLKEIPLHPVQELLERFPAATSSCEKTENGKMKCTWIVDGKKFDGVGQNGQIAKAVAACKALTQLNILTV